MIQIAAFITLGLAIALGTVVLVFYVNENNLLKKYRATHKRGVTPSYFEDVAKVDKIRNVLKWLVLIISAWIAIFSIGISLYLIFNQP